MAPQEHRTLLLLRHAKSAWPDVPDHERPLARRGQRDAPLMGHWPRAVGYVPDRVVCSTARRAAEAAARKQAVLAAERIQGKFPTAAVAAFVFRGGWDRLAPGAARLACFATPRELRRTG